MTDKFEGKTALEWAQIYGEMSYAIYERQQREKKDTRQEYALMSDEGPVRNTFSLDEIIQISSFYDFPVVTRKVSQWQEVTMTTKENL